MDALYYPRIEISDRSWLLSTALLWDHIRTITPDIASPYTEPVSLELLSEGILVPERVSPQSPPALNIAARIEDLLTSPEAGALVGIDSWLIRQSHIHRSKIESNLQHAIDSMFGRSEAHPDFCAMPSGIGAAYMLALATALAEAKGFRIVTDVPDAFRAAEAVLWPQRENHGRSAWDFDRQPEVSKVVDAVLTHVAHHWLRISPDTPVAKIVAFRQDRSDELQRLRDGLEMAAGQHMAVDGLPVSPAESQELVRRLLEDTLSPALEDVERCLRESRVDFTLDTIEAAIASELPGALAAAITTPWALVAAPALTVVVRATKFFLRHGRAVKDSPYSYLLRARHEFMGPASRRR